MSSKQRTVNFIYTKTNNFGLAKDVQVLTKLFHDVGGFTCATLDPHEPPKSCDIQVHCEVPVYANIPWASVNVFLVNAEYYSPEAFDPYLSAFDFVIVRDEATAKLFSGRPNVLHMPFLTLEAPKGTKTAKCPPAGWLYIIGGSPRKFAAAKAFVPLVREYDQPVVIYTSRTDYAKKLKALITPGARVTVNEEMLDATEVAFLQKNFAGHIVLSEAEGFSHAAAEARAHGAVQFATRCPVLLETAASTTVFGGDAAQLVDGQRFYTVDCSTISRADWTTAQIALATHTAAKRAAAKAAEEVRINTTKTKWYDAIRSCRELLEARLTETGIRHLPPVLLPDSCPNISIVTPTYNRRKFIDLAFHNLMWSDYPIDKIEWVVVEDSDDNDKSSSDKISAFAARCPKLTLNYIPLPKKVSVAEKRNIGCERATRDIIVFMDDDDHYPQTSLRRRVAWLLSPWAKSHKKNVVGCTMIAMYDLIRGTSAVNIPPWNLPLGQRVSEASLTFYKSFWEERGFRSADQIAEGESWLAGREEQMLEIPPQQILVAMSHGGNISSRRMPDDAKPCCFWGFSPEFLKLLHGMAGMAVEFNDLKDDGGAGGGGKRPAGRGAKK